MIMLKRLEVTSFLLSSISSFQVIVSHSLLLLHIIQYETMKYTGKGSPYVRPLPLQLLVILEGTEFYIVLE